MDLNAALPLLLPKAISWAESEADTAAGTGEVLDNIARAVAIRVGVLRPELIRVALVDELPMPQDPVLQAAAVQAGLLGPHMKGLTLGHSIFICHGHDSWRLLA